MSRNQTLILSIAVASLSLAFTVPVSASGKTILSNNSSVKLAQNSTLIQINRINLLEADNGLNLVLEIPSNKNPDGEIIDYDTYTIITLNNVNLALPDGANFLKNNPIAGIKKISVTQVDKENVEIKIVGDGKLPKVEEIKSTQGLTFSIATEVNTASTPQPTEATTQDEKIELNVVGAANPSETAPGTITVIDREQIRREQARDIRDLIRYEPGVSVPNDSRGGLQGFNIRGLDGNRVNLQVDGIRLPFEYSFGATRIGRDYVDIETLNALEIFKGNNSATLPSDALGGTVNFSTANALDFGQKVLVRVLTS
jgi:hemoglobin/transferrin/lactoferrin receptor protein